MNWHSITHEMAHLPHPWLPTLTLYWFVRMPMRMCGERMYSSHLHPRLVSFVCIKTCMSKYGGSVTEDLCNQGWCLGSTALFLVVMPTGFLCLRCSRSTLRQVRKKQMEDKRKLGWGTFSVKSSLIDTGLHTIDDRSLPGQHNKI